MRLASDFREVKPRLMEAQVEGYLGLSIFLSMIDASSKLLPVSAHYAPALPCLGFGFSLISLIAALTPALLSKLRLIKSTTSSAVKSRLSSLSNHKYLTSTKLLCNTSVSSLIFIHLSANWGVSAVFFVGWPFCDFGMKRSSRSSTRESRVAARSASSTERSVRSKMSLMSFVATALTREPVADAQAE